MTHHIISLSSIRAGDNSHTSSRVEDARCDPLPKNGVASGENVPAAEVSSRFAWARPSNDRAVTMATALRYLAARTASSTP